MFLFEYFTFYMINYIILIMIATMYFVLDVFNETFIL